MIFQVSSMRSLICTDELATDVTGAEALIERHNEHRVEIDARSNAFQVNIHHYRHTGRPYEVFKKNEFNAIIQIEPAFKFFDKKHP